MKISDNVYQIKINFQVTEGIQRFVYVYLITGENCYLIDSGIAGCEERIEAYLNKLGMDISRIKGIFLTHSHPDHIGGAAAIKRKTNCKLYASPGERAWAENIQQEYAERPIPNFYRLVKESVPVDFAVKDGERIELERGLSVKCVSTPGHSKDDMSYFLNDRILFTGDSIPVPDDFPILIDYERALESLKRLCGLAEIHYCCPAWHQACDGRDARAWIEQAQGMLRNLSEIVRAGQEKNIPLLEPEGLDWVKRQMGWSFPCENPLFRKTVACMMAPVVLSTLKN